MTARDAIQKIALEHRRRYGYRRITVQLRRQWLLVNHKPAPKLMRQDNLLAIGQRKFVITTDSKHELKVYVNLAARMELTGLNQLWVADITYIRLQAEFVYLSVVIDRYSRLNGWWDGRWTGRWRRAWQWRRWSERSPPGNRGPGLVHHSDRGFQ